MSVPVVICDDSSFARRQIARALPSGWDVSVTFAGGGEEALEAVRAGRGDILFLDLTMPGMDGFDVLQAIRQEDLPTLTIVVSGDIQPESRRRVKELGAVAFVEKPVDGERLGEVLDEYGLVGVLTGGSQPEEVGVAFTDWCQEIANVAMGRAGDLLAKVIAGSIELSVPRVDLLGPGQMEAAVASAVSAQWSAVVSQGFIGSRIAGETLLVFAETDMAALAEAMGFSEELTATGETELLTDISSVLVGAFLKGVSEQIGVGFSQGHPR
ncbi:MAG TPA: response regulator, partial [Gammaproteobacteria bacterium]|nr:response regulator [Gammaproteobacteria bacterium]